MDLRNRTVVVTGATGGIGRAIAVELASAGNQLILHGRRASVLDEVAAEAAAQPGAGGTAQLIIGDLRNQADLDELVAASLAADVLIANAGIGSEEFLSQTPDAIDAVVDVNLRAPIHLAHKVGAAMVERGSGQIVFVGSLAGKATASGSEIYSATKFGLRGFSHALRDNFDPKGVGVSLIEPGFIRDSGMFHEAGHRIPDTLTSTAEDVAKGVRRAIEDNRGVVTIAPVPVRAGAEFANAAPGVAKFLANRTPLGRMSPDRG